MNLKMVSFPVFKLGKDTPSIVDGVSFYYSEPDGKEKLQIIDDKNVPGDTLAKRRLRLASQRTRLYPLKISIWFLADLVKAGGGIYWIDSTGRIFKYEKSKSCKLIFKKITNIIPVPSAVLLEIEDMPGRYMALFGPTNGEQYVGMLKIEGGYVFYGYFHEKHKDTRRKI